MIQFMIIVIIIVR